MENDCSIEFYFQTTQGGYAGKNTFCMGVSAKIKNPYLCSLVLEPLNKKDAGGNIIVCFDNNIDWFKQHLMDMDYFFGNKSDKTPNVERFLNDLKKDFFRISYLLSNNIQKLYIFTQIRVIFNIYMQINSLA